MWRAAFCHWLEPHVSAFPPPLIFFSVHLSSTYCKQGWWDCGWKGLPVVTDPITKLVFPVLRSTGCSKSSDVFCAFMCVFEGTHTQAGVSMCTVHGCLCVFQRLMGLQGPPFVEANIREQTTYYYWSTPGQKTQPLCVGPLLSHSGDGLRWPSSDRGLKGGDGNIEIQRNTDQQAQRQGAIKR